MEKRFYRLEELAESAGVSARTVRYYTAEGLLPPPDARGRYALYTEEHVMRLQLIVRLKNAYLPLDAIRQKLDQVSPEDMKGLLHREEEVGAPASAVSEERVSHDEPPARRSAAAYIAGVLADRSQPAPSDPYMMRRPAATPAFVRDIQSDVYFTEPGAEAWYRITLAPGVELHVRRIDSFVTEIIAFAKGNRDET